MQAPRHSGLDPESSQMPETARFACHWIPAFAGMTPLWVACLIKVSLKLVMLGAAPSAT
jgi:hypothetical protein